MTGQPCDGLGLVAALRAGVANLEAHVDQVNAMNVFPVPDADTGSNMLATARAALAEAILANETSAGRAAAAVSRGALAGAQGNSGVIASQIARGLAESLEGKERISGLDLAHALGRSVATAYAAVAAPVEGTILTVIRDAADAAREAARDSDDPVSVLRLAVEAAESSVVRTPRLLAVLRDAGVPDAGGEGLFLVLAGALDSLPGAAPRRPRIEMIPRAHLSAPTGQEFGFETMFRLDATRGTSVDVEALRAYLGAIGHSVVVAGDAKAATVHVHGAAPDDVLTYAATLGAVSRVTIEDLDQQARDAFERERGALATAESPPGGAAATVRVVAIASGDGFAALLESLGAVVIAPDAPRGDLLNVVSDALHATAADDVVIVAGRAAHLAAQEAQRPFAERVRLVEVANAAEVAAALLAVDGTTDAATIARDMAAAAGRIQTIEVMEIADAARTALLEIERLDPGFELLTIYEGASASPEATDELRQSIAGLLPDVEVEIVRGGQPESTYLIAAE